MKKMKVDLAVIGGGPAGMAAALEAKRQGVEKVIIIERDKCNLTEYLTKRTF